MVIYSKTVSVFLLLSIVSSSYASSVRPFNEDDFKYHSYKAYSAVGFYSAATAILWR